MNRLALWMPICMLGCEEAPANPSPPPAGAAELRPVRVVRPKLEKLARDRFTPGILQPFEEVTLRAKVKGYLREIRVDIGDRVRAGQVLARLEIPEMDRELEMLAARVRQAEAQKAHAKAERDLQAIIVDRLEQVAKRAPEAIALHDVEKARAELAVKEAALKVAAAQIGARQADLSRGQALARYAVLRAPWNGAVAKRYVHPGALLDPGTSVVALVRASPLRLAVDVPEPDVRYLRVGDAVGVELDAFPGQSFEGKIARRAAALEPKTHTLRIEVELGNRDGKLVPGLYARVRLRLEAPRERLVIPPEALLREGDVEYVVVVEKGRARRRRVVKGLDTGATVEIRAGLKPTEWVVVAGHAGLRDGDPVQVPAPPPEMAR